MQTGLIPSFDDLRPDPRLINQPQPQFTYQ